MVLGWNQILRLNRLTPAVLTFLTLQMAQGELYLPTHVSCQDLPASGVVYPPYFLSAIFLADWRTCPPLLWRTGGFTRLRRGLTPSYFCLKRSDPQILLGAGCTSNAVVLKLCGSSAQRSLSMALLLLRRYYYLICPSVFYTQNSVLTFLGFFNILHMA